MPILRKLEKLSPLTEDDRATLKSLSGRVERFGSHQDLASDGEAPACVNLVVAGWVCRYKQLADGRRQILSFFVPGDMCDPLVFLLREITFTLVSLTPISVVRLSRAEMHSLLTKS